MKTYKRADRVKHLLQQEISTILQQDVKDPRVNFVTVTNVKLTDDLREARIFISTLGSDDERKRLLDGLQRATPFIRGELGRRLRLKYTPSLTFTVDESWEKQERILDLLDVIHQEDPPEDDRSDEQTSEEAPQP